MMGAAATKWRWPVRGASGARRLCRPTSSGAWSPHMGMLEERKIMQGWNYGDTGYPSHSRVSWSLMGGDAGFAWARAIVAQLDAADADACAQPARRRPRGNANGDGHASERDGMLVVPVVALVPGVVNGMLITEDELSRNVDAWNGRPVTLRHPRIGQQYVTANDPAIAERQQLGTFYNVDFGGRQAEG